MRGTDDLHLLETPSPTLLREVAGGLRMDKRRSFAMLGAAGIRSTQRLAIGEMGGGIAVFTWPAELVEQARHLYRSGRGRRLLEAAGPDGWEVDMRPHLAFWLSSPQERLYMNPRPPLTPEEYVIRWEGDDGVRIGEHARSTVPGDLWPWLLDRGYASACDQPELSPFLERLEKRNRDAHLRPGLRLLRRWRRDEVASLHAEGALADTVSQSVNSLLHAVDDPPLPRNAG